MTDSPFDREPAGKPPTQGAAVPEEETPQFGAVDIVEAFTAMRHEWRGQTKETRALAEQIQAAVAGIQALEEKQRAAGAEKRPQPTLDAKPLALLIVETDQSLSRAVEAVAQSIAKERLRAAAAADAVERQIASMSRVARWFASPLLALLTGQQSVHETATDEHPAVAGLNMVLARLQNAMREQGLERLEVLGKPFDAETMHAIGVVSAVDCPPGYVAEQLSPAYRWQGRMLRFADVRVADGAAPAKIAQA